MSAGPVHAAEPWPEAPAPSCDHDQGCIACGDVAVEMLVLRVDAQRGLALCEDTSGARETVEAGLVDRVVEGDRVLVHAGTAIARAGAEEFA